MKIILLEAHFGGRITRKLEKTAGCSFHNIFFLKLILKLTFITFIMRHTHFPVIVNLLLIGDIWQLNDSCRAWDYCNLGFICGHIFPTIVRALFGASFRLCVAYWQRNYYVCSAVETNATGRGKP